MDHRVIGLVENRMIDIARFEKEIARPVDDCFVWQDVSHVARRDLPDSRPDMVVLPNVSAGRQRQFGNAKLILSIDLAQKARERSFEFCRDAISDPGNAGCGVDHKGDRASGLGNS